ncbi:aminotransferase class I/II-fold pyridoxal phosphate-dependent enzyme [Effusibacillus pohliae]|uniref:aminotransferase class I/II-fold pyridoxal phosphate-dependent enzyme n=1 Tax=Effusibacillus pohliae TaxID=232270 RepID=UPI000362A654|nr:aminotransferase class I/II-fold pyridoxal phosphate-dependent enzyme [Effusibacillus pohliae]
MERIPVLEAMRAHLQSNPLPLHVPGHKMGRGFPAEAAVWLGQALRLDLTELPGLDDLHQPQGPIREAQQLAARAFGSEETYFLVGGSTAGNLAMILTVCRPGETVVIPRNAHKSVHHAVMLAGAKPVYLYPEVDGQFAIPTVIRVEEVRRVLAEHPDARAVLITSPTYQGVCSDISEIAGEVHRHGKLLLVDEAHGAHFPFHEQLPPTAIQSGADLVVQSTHKMLGSLTGTAMLHGKNGRYDRERLRTMLGMVQTSSPSYLMLLSLDAARHQMQTCGRELIDRALQALAHGRREAAAIGELALYQGGPDVCAVDPFKWWIQVRQLGLTGFEAERLLREKRGIFCEMADRDHLLAVFSYADTDKQVSRLLEGLRFLAEVCSRDPAGKRVEHVRPVIARTDFRLEQVMIPKDALQRARRRVKLEAAVGQVAAEPVIPYPPGIPLVLPGERYTAELIAHLQDMKRIGSRFQGTEDAALESVCVLE